MAMYLITTVDYALMPNGWETFHQNGYLARIKQSELLLVR
jgi:hypothetical protein